MLGARGSRRRRGPLRHGAPGHRPADLRANKGQYADKSGKPFKRYRTLKLKWFKDRVLAAESVMENLQTGSKTAMTVLKLEESALGG